MGGWVIQAIFDENSRSCNFRCKQNGRVARTELFHHGENSFRLKIENVVLRLRLGGCSGQHLNF